MHALRRTTWVAALAVATTMLLFVSVPHLGPTPAGGIGPQGPVSCSTTTAVSYGAESVAGAIASPGADACFTFTTAVGDEVWLNMATTSGTLAPFYDFFRPGPVSTCASPYEGATFCTVPSGGSGSWTLQISDGSGTHTGDFRLSLQRLDVGVGCTAAKYGQTLDAKIAKKASFACVTFTASAGDALYARSTGTSGSIGTPAAIETSPTGSVQCQSNGLVECPLPGPGVQTLVLYSESGKTKGSFVLYLQRTSGPKHCTAVTAGGAKVSGAVAGVGDVACFDFTGTSGDTDTVTLSKLTGTLAPLIDFFRPVGTSACASPATSVTCVLDSTGTWTVLVDDDAGPGTGTFTFALTKT